LLEYITARPVIVWPRKRAPDGYWKDVAMYINQNVPETRWRSERQVRRKFGAMLVWEGNRKQKVVQEVEEDLIAEVDLFQSAPSPMMIADMCEALHSLASPL